MKYLCALVALAGLCLPARGDTYLVLPFFNSAQANNMDWIGESVAWTVREALASQGLMTVDREDRQEAYRRLGLRSEANLTRATILKLGQALDADQVIYGEYEFRPSPAGSASSRGSLKLTAHILSVRTLRQGPEFSELGALEDLAAQQAHLAWQTLRTIAPENAPSESEFRRQFPQVRVDAMESYIRGLLSPTIEQKHKLLAQAARLEPSFSPAAFQLGMLAYSRKDHKTAAEWLSKVAAADPRFRQATFYLGICRYETGDYPRAQSAFETVVKTVPLNEVFNNLGAALSRQNQNEAVDTFAKALEGDPSDPVYHFNVGYALWTQGKFDAAAERFRAVLERDPQDTQATTLLGKCLKQVGPDASDRAERLERIKTTFEENAYWQLKALLQPQKR